VGTLEVNKGHARKVNKRQALARKGHPPKNKPKPNDDDDGSMQCHVLARGRSDDASGSSSNSGGAASSHPCILMVCSTTMVTDEQAIPRERLAGTAAERRYMERKWCERLWQTMQRVRMHSNRLTTRAVERAAKRQCKKDGRQTKALLAKARD
jgi:hypothetical protein